MVVSLKPNLALNPPALTRKLHRVSFADGSLIGSDFCFDAYADSFLDTCSEAFSVLHGHGGVPPIFSMVHAALEYTIDRNLTISSDVPVRSTVFDGAHPPPITLDAYIQRLAKYTKCSAICFVMAAMYIHNVSQAHPDILLSSHNVHRLLLTGVMLSAKFIDDHYFNNAFYARVGGVSTSELNRLELEMLQLLDFRLHLNSEAVKTGIRHLASGLPLTGLMDGLVLHAGRKRRSSSGIADERKHRRSSVGCSESSFTSEHEHVFEAVTVA